MRQTVTGRFRTWDDARHAQDALVLKGFAANDIELPAQPHGVLAGIERLVTSFFAHDPRARGTRDAGSGPMAPGDTVLLGVLAADEAHADLARDILRDEHALEIAMRSAAWTWPLHDEEKPRERSALDELGLAGVAGAVRRRAAAAAAAASAAAARREAAAPPAAGSAPAAAGASAGTSATAPGHVDVPGAPEATQPAKETAPQIPDEFLEYEDDTPAHHRTLH